MAFDNFLSQIGSLLGGQMQPAGGIPGFAGGMINPQQMVPGMGGLEQSLAQNQALGQQRQRQVNPDHIKPNFANVLGLIGDAVRGFKGQPATYGPAMQQRQRQAQMGDALANYLGNNDAALAEIMRADPETGMALYKMTHQSEGAAPETIRLMQAAGIDPQSPEGKQIIQQHLQGGGQADATFIRELNALGIDPHSAEARELYYGRNSPAGFLLKPKGGSQGPSGGPQVGQAVNGFIFKGGNPNDRNSWEPAGGASVAPARPFP